MLRSVSATSRAYRNTIDDGSSIFNPLASGPTWAFQGGVALSASSWTSQGSATSALTQAVGASQPTIVTLNSISVPDFQGDYYESTAALSVGMTASAFTCIWVCKPSAYTANLSTSYANDMLFTNSPQYFWIYGQNSATPGIGVGLWDGAEKKTSPVAAATGSTYVCHCTLNSGTLSITVGTGSDSVAAGNVQNMTGTIYMGFGPGASNFRGIVADFYVWNTALSAGQIAAHRAYLLARYPGSIG